MDLGLLVMWIVVGLMAGRLAGVVMKSGGYGLNGDFILGLVGSIVGSWLFWTLGVTRGGGMLSLVVAAFIGAVSVILAQRQFWYAHA